MQLKPSIFFFYYNAENGCNLRRRDPCCFCSVAENEMRDQSSLCFHPPNPQPFSCERRLLINHANHKVPLGNMWACRANCCTFSGINARSGGWGTEGSPPQPLPAASAVSSLTFWPLLTLLLAMRSSSDIPTLGPCPGKNLLRAWEYEVAWMKRARPTRLL